MELPTQVVLRVGESYVLRLKGLGAAEHMWRYEINGPGDVVKVSLEMAGPEPRSDEVAQQGALGHPVGLHGMSSYSIHKPFCFQCSGGRT